jgi:hypothetical protein
MRVGMKSIHLFFAKILLLVLPVVILEDLAVGAASGYIAATLLLLK